MTREQAKELLPVIQAFAEGKTIQVRGIKPESNWVDADEKDLDLLTASFTYQWRVKPEPRDFWLRSPKDSSLPWNVWFGKPDPSPDHDIIHVREVME